MSYEEFRPRAAQGGLIPVSRELLLDIETPISAFDVENPIADLEVRLQKMKGRVRAARAAT